MAHFLHLPKRYCPAKKNLTVSELDALIGRNKNLSASEKAEFIKDSH